MAGYKLGQVRVCKHCKHYVRLVNAYGHGPKWLHLSRAHRQRCNRIQARQAAEPIVGKTTTAKAEGGN